MILRDEVIKKLENERDSWSMRAFSEDNTSDGSDYLCGYYIGYANALNAVLVEIKGQRREKGGKAPVLKLIQGRNR